MIVSYLDLATGRTAKESGVSVFALIDGNWSCDCNRHLAFEDIDEVQSDDPATCEGCKRFIVYDVAAEPSDGEITVAEIVREANEGYYAANAAVQQNA